VKRRVEKMMRQIDTVGEEQVASCRAARHRRDRDQRGHLSWQRLRDKIRQKT